MSSWSSRTQSKLPQKAIYTEYDSEDNNVINLNITRNTTNYPDSDISVILKKTNDYNIAIVETITLDNSFTPYILFINMNKFIIKNSNETIQLFTINNRKVVIPDIKIPKKIIHTWNTKDIENTELNYAIKVIKIQNPEYNYKLVDEEERKEFIKNNYDDEVYVAYNKLKPGAYKADLWRYCYLYKYGGIYTDIKMVFKKSFNALLKNTTNLVLGKAMYNDGVNNGFIACMPNENLMKLAIDESVKRIQNNYYGISSLDITGPLLLEYCFNKLYGISSSEYIDNQNDQLLMVRYNDINNYNCFLFNNHIMAYSYFSTYYINYRTSPYIAFWKNKDVYNIE
jgi:mannosyltransferase OCH1-like enzyme